MVVVQSRQPYFTKYILQRIKQNKNFICALTGQTGSGKSWSALKLGEILDPEFDARNVCFDPIQFMALVNGETKELKKGSVILFDEIQVSMSHLESLSLQNRLLNYVMQTFRHKNFILIVTTPQFSFISASARKLFHARIETMAIDFKLDEVVLKPLLLQISQRENKVYQKYLRVYVNGVPVPLKQLRLGKPSDKLIADYEQKKGEFTKRLNKDISLDLDKMYNKKHDKDKPQLTERQLEVINHLKAGLNVHEIAIRMNIIERAVHAKIASIHKKGIKITSIREPKSNRVIRYEVQGDV